MRLHRAWLIAAITFLSLIAAAAFRSTTSVMLMPLEMEFGWTRELTSAALSLNLVFYGLTAPFAAILMDKFSIKRVVCVALVMVSLGTGLTIFMTQPWQLLFCWGVLVGGGTGAMALVFASMVANRWFVARRGLVTGIFSAAYATGQLIFLPMLAQVITADGWRWASVVVAPFALALVPVFIIWFKDSPAAVGLRPYGAPEGELETTSVKRTVRESFKVLRAAMRTAPFWVLAATFFVCGWTTNGLIGAHFVPAAHDHGMPATTAAGLLATVGIFDFIGTIASGWLTDKVNSAWLLVAYYGLRGLALFTVPFVLAPTVEPPLMFFIVFYGLDWIATVPPTVQLCRKYFGLENTGIIYGWVFASHMVGAAVAAEFAGVVRQVQGDYFIAWITAAVLCLAAALAALTLRKPRLRELSVT